MASHGDPRELEGLPEGKPNGCRGISLDLAGPDYIILQFPWEPMPSHGNVYSPLASREKSGVVPRGPMGYRQTYVGSRGALRKSQPTRDHAQVSYCLVSLGFLLISGL